VHFSLCNFCALGLLAPVGRLVTIAGVKDLGTLGRKRGCSLVKIAQFRKKFYEHFGGVYLIVQGDAQKRTVDLQPTVVVDEAKLPELVHEEAHS
jgi:hypothetical protein